MILVTEIYAVTLGQAVAALSPTILIAALLWVEHFEHFRLQCWYCRDSNPFLLVLFSIFCGVTAPPPTLPYFWRKWMWPLDPFTRLIRRVIAFSPLVCSWSCLPIVVLSPQFFRIKRSSARTENTKSSVSVPLMHCPSIANLLQSCSFRTDLSAVGWCLRRGRWWLHQ